MRKSFASRSIPTSALPPYRQLTRIAIQRDTRLPLWSFGPFAIATILHLLLGGRLPHSLPANYIIRDHMCHFTRTSLNGLYMAPPPLLADVQLSPRRNLTPTRGVHWTILLHKHRRGKTPTERSASAPHGSAPRQHSKTKGSPHVRPGGPAPRTNGPKGP